eukprot:jgi/Mesvir1/16240/Mv08494-RA.1
MSTIRLASITKPALSGSVNRNAALQAQPRHAPAPGQHRPTHRKLAVRASHSSEVKLNSLSLTNPTMDTVQQLKLERDERRKELQALETLIKEIKSQVEVDPLKLAPADYGFKSRGGSYLDEDAKLQGPPPTALVVAAKNFVAESTSIWYKIRGLREPEPELSPEVQERRAKLAQLTLSNDAIWKREYSRPQVETSPIIKVPYLFLCWLLDVVFDGRPIQRFWFLETVARMPYFSYLTMLHGYETLGWWRFSAELKRVHFAEEWNEFQHLIAFEALGGDREWLDRFVARHSAIVYYGVLILLWLLSPSLAYNFSELIESHAVDSYNQFRDENEELLKSLPPPPVIYKYYTGPDMYMFDEFQTSRAPGSRRPPCRNLYDVFTNVSDDEDEHVKTMAACQEKVVESPNTLAMTAASIAASTAALVALKQAPFLLQGAEASTLTDLIVAIAKVLPDLPFLHIKLPFF